ncbi:uncharacterized protein A4U43_C07F32160 [Asparagus officinalis]|uniref:Uncharacterized protein n=1 Tax=Asparagus officinalis TaxID=4686 RepID=A0A5P1ELQ6_ASPOF|nr:uncharacterized protein A4U43_C07F32160 [Asparagus officinalis]
MLRDVIDLRKNMMQQRRKVEGPKKIEEVHGHAAQERQSQTSRLTRDPGMSSASRRGPPVDYSPRGSSVLPTPQAGVMDTFLKRFCNGARAAINYSKFKQP